jgi:LysR family transcriptional regulator, nod-box dependent transcriptional activator
MTDDASSVILPLLTKRVGTLAPGVTLEVIPWHERVHEDNVAVHLILNPFATPTTFRFESLYRDHFVCVRGQQFGRGKHSISLKEYLGFRHVSVETQANQHNLIDRSLLEAGFRRQITLRLPYYETAIRLLESTTDLVLTMPARLADNATGLRFPTLKAPKEITPIRYSMMWHPRFDSDLLHNWLRDLVRQVSCDVVSDDTHASPPAPRRKSPQAMPSFPLDGPLP